MKEIYKEKIRSDICNFKLTRTSNIFYLDDYYYLNEIKNILEDHFKNLKIIDKEIFHWLVMLDYNQRLEKLLLAIYFKIPEMPIDFDLSSFSKFRDNNNYDVYRNTHYRR